MPRSFGLGFCGGRKSPCHVLLCFLCAYAAETDFVVAFVCVVLNTSHCKSIISPLWRVRPLAQPTTAAAPTDMVPRLKRLPSGRADPLVKQ